MALKTKLAAAVAGFLGIAAGTLFAGTPDARELPIVPAPEKIEILAGTTLTPQNLKQIFTDKTAKNAAEFFQKRFRERFGKTLPLTVSIPEETPAGAVVFKTTRGDGERHTIEIKNNKIIVAGTPAGTICGAGTLDCLCGEKTLPALKISDAPAFPHRALMVDSARHFLPLADLKKFITLMARFKFNTLHLHLSDDQGWRVEIKGERYKKLMSVAAQKNKPAGTRGFYTQEEIRELVKFAAKHNIEIVPEIDIPGHSSAAIAAYPELTCESVREINRSPEKLAQNPKAALKIWEEAGVSEALLCAGTPEVLKFYDGILEQLCALFPSKKFHLGGDEAPTKCWEQCKNCRQFMRKNNLKTTQDLMAAFFEHFAGTLKKYNKKAIFWTELDVPAYPKNSVFCAWRMNLTPNAVERAKREKRKVILCSGEYAYLDYPQTKNEDNHGWMPVLTLEQTYDFKFLNDGNAGGTILGCEGLLWSEHIEDYDRLVYQAFPRALAIAEAAWSKPENRRDFENFNRRIQKLGFNTEK